MQQKRKVRVENLTDLGSVAKQTKGAVKGIMDTLGQPQSRFGITDD